jgi:hypothetical protein
LTICLKLVDHIESIRPGICSDVKNTTSSGVVREANMSVPRMMDDTLDVCTQSLNRTAQHIQDIAKEDQAKVEMDEAEIIRQLGGTRKCLEYMRKSEKERVNIFEKIDAAEDSRTIMVSTIGDLIRGTDVKFGARAGSVMGQLSDESLQRIVENFSPPDPSRSDKVNAGRDSSFVHRYGSGQKI